MLSQSLDGGLGKIFTTFPLASTAVQPEEGRCPEWQCAVTGRCIAHSSVYGRNDCIDGSDEDSEFCEVAFLTSGGAISLMAGSNRATRTSGFAFPEIEWRAPTGIEAEFNELLAKTDQGELVRFEGSGRPVNAEKTETRSELKVAIIGALQSVDWKVRSGERCRGW